MAFWRKDPYKSQTGVADLFWIGLFIMLLGFGIGYYQHHHVQPGMSTNRADLIVLLSVIAGGSCWLAALLRRV